MFSKKAVTSISSSGQRRLWSACQVPKVAPSGRRPMVAAREGLAGRGKALRRSAGEGHRSLEATVERRGRGRRAPSPHTCQQTPRRHSTACRGSWNSAGTNTDFSRVCFSLMPRGRGAPCLLRGSPGVTDVHVSEVGPATDGNQQRAVPLARLAGASSLCAALGAPPQRSPGVLPCGQRP